MRIAVLTKQVPDTWGERSLDPASGRVDRITGEQVMDEVVERALELALTAKDLDRTREVVAVTMGPDRATEHLRKALAMGADRALHIVDDRLENADASQTARVLAAALRGLSPDLILAGNASTDGGTGIVPSMIAEHLDLPCLSSVESADVHDGAVSCVRLSETGLLRMTARIPAIVTVTERAPEARFPTFRGIIAAKKKSVETLGLGALNVELPDSQSAILSVTRRPPRTAGQIVAYDSTAVERLVDFLAMHRLTGAPR